MSQTTHDTLNSYTITQLLGQGQYSQVYELQSNTCTNTKKVAKLMRLKYSNFKKTNQYHTRTTREIDILKKIGQHENVIELLEYYLPDFGRLNRNRLIYEQEEVNVLGPTSVDVDSGKEHTSPSKSLDDNDNEKIKIKNKNNIKPENDKNDPKQDPEPSCIMTVKVELPQNWAHLYFPHIEDATNLKSWVAYKEKLSKEFKISYPNYFNHVKTIVYKIANGLNYRVVLGKFVVEKGVSGNLGFWVWGHLSF